MRRKQFKSARIFVGIFCCVMLIASVGIWLYAKMCFGLDNKPLLTEKITPPEEILEQYMSLINEREFEKMYDFLDEQSKQLTSLDEFVEKNRKIYDGIEAHDLSITINEVNEQQVQDAQDETQKIVSYETKMGTLAGELTFSNQAIFTESGLLWYTQLIFPMLNPEDRVRINTLKATRGNIYDRNGELLAGEGVASSVGFVAGKMNENPEDDIARAAELLEMSVESIGKKLSASYVKEDTFVPLKTIPAGLVELEDSLLEIKGIKISNIPVRYYPMAEKASHLTGYIQNVTAEDLENLQGKGYNANSVIGKSGLEKIYEETLQGIDGYEIIVIDKDGNRKENLAKKPQKNGSSINLTIDGYLQSTLYDQLRDDKACAVAMNPKTGEVLALVSTPTFNANDFVIGLSQSKWDELNSDENKPFYNRFKAALCPGSGFKSVIAAIGLTTKKLDPYENYGYSGKSWQKDASWGGYKITTLKDYGSEVILKNALIYSDNIYFAKAALNIGADTLTEQLLNIGFEEKIPFEYSLYSSSISSTEKFESEIQLADSGYGQGQILVNPIHMASIYSAFLNQGNMIKPYLIKQANQAPEIWKAGAFTPEAAEILKEDLKLVAQNSYKTLGLNMNKSLAGKTGTAEIKLSKDDKEGTELGWFNVFTADDDNEKPLLIITMVEDVKNRNGSSYVIPKVNEVFKSY